VVYLVSSAPPDRFRPPPNPKPPIPQQTPDLTRWLRFDHPVGCPVLEAPSAPSDAHHVVGSTLQEKKPDQDWIPVRRNPARPCAQWKRRLQATCRRYCSPGPISPARSAFAIQPRSKRVENPSAGEPPFPHLLSTNACLERRALRQVCTAAESLVASQKGLQNAPGRLRWCAQKKLAAHDRPFGRQSQSWIGSYPSTSRPANQALCAPHRHCSSRNNAAWPKRTANRPEAPHWHVNGGWSIRSCCCAAAVNFEREPPIRELLLREGVFQCPLNCPRQRRAMKQEFEVSGNLAAFRFARLR